MSNFIKKILKEWNDTFPNTANYPGMGSNDFEEYMNEDTLADRMTMETGAIPNSLDEEKKVEEVLKELEESLNEANPHDKDSNGEYLIDKIKDGILPFRFLEALIDYTDSPTGGKGYKKTITKYVNSLPILNDFKQAPTYLYRVVKIYKGWKSYEPGIYSYTTSAKMALSFFEDDYLGNERAVENMVILKIKTDKQKVILNIDELLNSKLYAKSLRFYKLNWGVGGHEEQDILYNQPQITKKDLYLVYSKGKWVKPNSPNKKKI